MIDRVTGRRDRGRVTLPVRLRRRLLLSATAASGLVVVGCSGGDEDDPAGSGASAPGDSPTPTPSTAAPVMGASQVLLPDPTGAGVLLLTGPPEGAADDGPLLPWRWDGEAWTQLPSDMAPGARSFFAATYDPARKVVVLFGGDPSTGETWEWDGRRWRGLDVPGPDGVMSASLAYDPATGVVTLYGGNEQEGDVHGETWSWDGAQWGMIAGRGPEPIRWPAAMVADAVGHALVLYGGHQVVDPDLPAALADTWVWADARWTSRPNAAGPGRLVNAQALDHPQLGTLLLGGSDLEQATGDVWHWDGDRWLPMAQGVFPARQAFGLAYDAARDVVVLTGGLVEPGSPQRHQDLWEWSGDPNDRAVQVDAREPA